MKLKYRHTILGLLLLFSCLFFLYQYLGKEEEPFLSVYLRCDKHVAGSLLITTRSEHSQKLIKENIFKLTEACSKKEIRFSPFYKEKMLVHCGRIVAKTKNAFYPINVERF